MSSRVVTLSVVALVLTAGCSGTLVERSSSPATIPPASLAATGYEHGNTTEVPITYPVGMAGLRGDVTVRTWLSGYLKTTEENDTAVLVLFSSPNVEVADRSVNPLSTLSNRKLVGFVLKQVARGQALGKVDGVGNLTEAGVRERIVLGEPTEVVTYAGVAELEGERGEVLVHIAVVEHGEDLIVAIGIHEAGLDETENIGSLVERIEHAEAG